MFLRFQRVVLRKKYVWIEWISKDLVKQPRERNIPQKRESGEDCALGVTEVIKN